MNSSDMKVVSYCQVPALFYSTKVTTKGVILKVPVHPNVYANTTRATSYPDYLAFGTGFYRYYRGSIRYLFQFVGTPFYSARFKISVVHSLVAPVGGTGNGTGFMSRIVDVKGDAWTSFVVPLLGRRMWSYTTTASDSIPNVPFLILELLTDVQGSSLPSDASYYVNVWRAAGPDYQLAMQISNTGSWVFPSNSNSSSLTTTNSGWTKQSSLAKKWNEPSEGLKEGSQGYHEANTYMTDQSTTITDMFKRFVPHWATADTVISYPSDWLFTTTKYPIHLFSSSFLFWRGSRVIKNSSISIYSQVYPRVDPTGPDFGRATAIDPTAQNTNSYTVPWYSPELAYTTTIARHDYNPVEANSPADIKMLGYTQQLYIAAGDDFAYYWLVPPNPNAVIAANAPPSSSALAQPTMTIVPSSSLKNEQAPTVKHLKAPEMMPYQ
jgi:hypothetical protein